MSDSKKIIELQSRLQATDLEMARILEDLIHVLVQRGVIRYSDFTDESRDRLQERQRLREELKTAIGTVTGAFEHLPR